MKKIILLLLIFVDLNCFYNPTGPAQTELDREFDLKLGKKAVVGEEGLFITFIDVLEDSRCPLGYYCFWAGNGAVLLKIEKLGSYALSDTLNTTLEPRSLDYLNYNITLKNLKPYPIPDSTIQKGDYIVTLLVNKVNKK
jgi:hypothetical protein